MSKYKIIVCAAIALILVLSIGALAISMTGGSDLSKQLKLGEKYLLEGKYEEAILAFEKAIQIDPKNVDARIGLAKAYVATEKLDEAEKVLKEALELVQDRPEVYIELAKVYILEGQTDEAIKLLEQGYETTKDEKIKKLLDEIKSNPEGAVDIIQEQTKPAERHMIESKDIKKEVVNFEDKEFEKYVREKINKENGEIFNTDLMRITSIALNHGNSLVDIDDSENVLVIDKIQMRTFNDLKHFPKLKSLQITDLKIDLKDLHLEELNSLTGLCLENTQTIDLSALSGLKNLTSFYMYNSQVSDISVLSGLTNLKYLGFDNTPISEISALKGLTKLERLDLVKCSISDISALAGLTNLKHLDLARNQIKDISALRNLTNLESIVLDENPISDINALSGLTKLNFLSSYGTQISDISALSGLTNLTHLYIPYNPIKDFSPLDGLKKLDEVSLRTINEMKEGKWLGRPGE